MAQGPFRIFGPFAAVALLPILTSANAAAQVPGVGANAQVRDASGRMVATADFREGRNEVLITLTFASPPALNGTHAVHINEVGRCDPPDFTSSGAIFNPLNKQHGRQNPEGAEVGDLPNVNFSNGLSAYNTTAIGATLGQGPASLLAPSRALVFFSGEDDQKTGPEGNAGTRIACGVIQAGGSAAPAPGGPAVGTSPASPARVAAITPVAPSASPVASAPAVVGQAPAKPASSPIVVVSKPVVAASPTAPLVAALPTPIAVVAAAQSAPQSSGLSATNALILAVLGAALITIGYLLRQGRALR